MQCPIKITHKPRVKTGENKVKTEERMGGGGVVYTDTHKLNPGDGAQ